MSIFSRSISTNRFTFTFEGLHVSMNSKPGVVVTQAPATAIARIYDNEIDVFTSKANNQGTGPTPCFTASFSEFVSVLVKSEMNPAPKWWQNPFKYQQRLSEWEAISANPTFFEITDSEFKRWDNLCNSVNGLCSGHRLIADATLYSVYGYQSRKGHGGGENVLSTKDVYLQQGQPSRTNTNISMPGLVCDLFELWFFPQFMLLQTSATAFKAITYSNFRVEVKENTLITNEHFPNAQVLGYTWRYVNKDGSPDRRYSTNEQLPILRVWELDFISGDDRIDLQTTNGQSAFLIAEAFRQHPV